jgi:hypothetical protein
MSTTRLVLPTVTMGVQPQNAKPGAIAQTTELPLPRVSNGVQTIVMRPLR